MRVTPPIGNTFANLYTLSGIPAGTSVVVTNNSSYSVFIAQKETAPLSRVGGDSVYVVPTGDTVVVHGNDLAIWISGEGGDILVQPLSGTIAPFTSIDLPHDVYTSDREGYRRLRVDVAQTGFFLGKQFEFIKKFTSPKVFRFTCSVPFILQFQNLTVTSGKVELFAWHSSNVTPSGTWTTDPTPIHRLNDVETSYTGLATIESGGTIAVANQELYRDYIVVETASASGQRTSVGTHSADERYHAPGTFYLQLVGTGTGGYSIAWEERDPV